LAFVQGATEFLPVSSSGHLLLARLLLQLPDVQGLAFDAFLHLGTLGAVLAYYWRTWARLSRDLAYKLVIATIPGALAGYFLEDLVEQSLRGPRLLALSFLITALVLWWFDLPAVAPPAGRAKAGRTIETLTLRDAFITGLWQIAALVPAISRSGVTIAAGRARGLTRTEATTWSFLMSAPIIAGASLHGLWELMQGGSFSGELLAIGTLVSFISGLAAIYLLMRYIERISFKPFAIYLVCLAVVVWITAG